MEPDSRFQKQLEIAVGAVNEIQLGTGENLAFTSVIVGWRKFVFVIKFEIIQSHGRVYFEIAQTKFRIQKRKTVNLIHISEGNPIQNFITVFGVREFHVVHIVVTNANSCGVLKIECFRIYFI